MEWSDERLQEEFYQIHVKLDRIDNSLRGNGKLGVVVRLERLELRERIRGKVLWLTSSIVLTMVIILAWKLILGVTDGSDL